MLVFIMLSVLSLVNPNIFFAPLFLFVYLYLVREYFWLVILLLALSLVGDLVWVFPLGFSGLLFSLLLAALSLYSQRYNVLNFGFIFALLAGGSVLMFFFARPEFSWLQIALFVVFFTYLRFEIRELHKQSLKNLA
jgi:hypothetical protein